MMPEIPAQKQLRCAGCSRQFDADGDVCPIPHVIGSADVGFLCARCHITVLGDKPSHTFRQAELLPLEQQNPLDLAQSARDRTRARSSS